MSSAGEKPDNAAAAIDAAAELIADAKNVLVLSGAGISAESGIPTFREAQTGLWARFSPEDLASPQAFARDPQRVWAWYHWRRTLIARGGANAGHHALAALADYRPTQIVTQNVDGLHAAAGSRGVAELHGNIWRERCTACDFVRTVPVAEAVDDSPVDCAACGALLRPDIVWFGEMLPAAALRVAEQAIAKTDCVLVVGTSNRVYPAASFVEAALDGPAVVIEINPETTPISSAVDCRIATTASHALPALLPVRS